MNREPVTDEIVEVVAEKAHANEKTIYRRLLGLPVRGSVGRRIDFVLEELGLKPKRAANPHHRNYF